MTMPVQRIKGGGHKEMSLETRQTLTSHMRLSRKRFLLPGVPENWKVACTTYGVM